MAAQSIDTFVIDVGDPNRPQIDPARARVDANISFEFFTNNVQTLSTNYKGSNVAGLLFVPTLLPSDPCADQYVPRSATRLENIPSQYQYLAFAPWFSADCTRSYLAAARNQVSAFLFYVPSQNTTVTPPVPNDPIWNLGDGGRWKSQNRFPVYAMPGAYGAMIMEQLAQYSGNVSAVKNGNILLDQERIDPTDYIRLFSTFSINGNSNLPTLWAFLLIVLGVVLLLVGLTSFSMHYVQRRNRRDLQQRVESGEVDLESLGIKRPRLTQADIDALPLIPYVPNEKKPPLPLPSPTGILPPTENTPNTPAPAAVHSPQDYNQPTCPICLDDYVPTETSVRSLPCHHIYHPDCIDRYLLHTSSQCPICKSKVKSSASSGSSPAPGAPHFCPPITNAMVRRERYARRLRERGQQAPSNNESTGRWATFHRHFHLPVTRRVPIVPAPGAMQEPTASQIEMGTLSQPAPSTSAPAASSPSPAAAGSRDIVPTTDASTQPTAEPMPPQRSPQDLERRREWARRRASALLGRGAEGGTTDAEEEDRVRRAGLPRWRRALGGVFPGFR